MTSYSVVLSPCGLSICLLLLVGDDDDDDDDNDGRDCYRHPLRVVVVSGDWLQQEDCRRARTNVDARGDSMSLTCYTSQPCLGTNQIHGKKCMISRQNF